MSNSREFLSQDEVDSLLDGIHGEPDEKEKAAAEPEGVKPYNLASQERIVRGRMPTMEIINERFARQFRISLFNFMRRTAEISIGQLRAQKFSEFIRNLPIPANINIMRTKQLRGNALLVLDPNLVFLVVDNMFGGDGRFHVRAEGREFTQTEQRIIRKLIDVTFESLSKAWEGVYPLEFEFVRSEVNPQFANIATPNEVVISTSFDVEFGETGGTLHLCIPYSMIEPVRDLLYSSMQADHLSVDKRWMKMLSRQVQSAEVELVALLGHSRLTVEHVLRMQAGDVIPLESSGHVTAYVDKIEIMECKYGVFNNQYALKVEKMLVGSSSELANGD
jgi:flagellar motor switch protein FliM